MHQSEQLDMRGKFGLITSSKDDIRTYKFMYVREKFYVEATESARNLGKRYNGKFANDSNIAGKRVEIAL
jgi:hypothetical protein